MSLITFRGAFQVICHVIFDQVLYTRDTEDRDFLNR